MGWPEAKIKTPPPWKKECYYTDERRDVLEITPPSDLEICLSIDYIPPLVSVILHSSSHIFVAGATEARWFFTGPAPGGRGKSSPRQKGSFSRLSHLFLIPWYLLLISLPYVSSHCLLTFIFNKFRQPKRIILKTFSPLFHHLFKFLLKTSARQK